MSKPPALKPQPGAAQGITALCRMSYGNALSNLRPRAHRLLHAVALAGELEQQKFSESIQQPFALGGTGFHPVPPSSAGAIPPSPAGRGPG